jgi:cell division protein YceG involved in septum cleavage|tara:strand:+ start:20 stop:406 length:387 start_codon:yes stop_codon:yes gene_type:complete
MWDKIKNTVSKLQGKKEETVTTNEDKRRAILAKEKEEATAKGEPWVAVLDTQLNPDNIKNGFFELDWNNQFIEELLDAGYTGETNEEIVDGWFKTIAVQILGEQGVETAREMGYINVVPIDKDKSEVS